MSKYRELVQNPPKLSIKKDAREIIFNIVSCMCDNKHTLRLKKNEEGDFKLSGMGNALSNYQFEHKVVDIEWEADNNNWVDVINMINSGTSKIESLKSR